MSALNIKPSPIKLAIEEDKKNVKYQHRIFIAAIIGVVINLLINLTVLTYKFYTS